MTPDTVERIDADDSLLAGSTLSRIDHVDVHRLRTEHALQHTPQEWAREILEGPSTAMRVRLHLGWTALGIALHRGAVSIALHRGAVDTIAGWPVSDSGVDYVRLQSDSRIGLTGELLTRVGDHDVTFATLVQLANPVARRVWASVLPAHLNIVRTLMQGAADRTT